MTVKNLLFARLASSASARAARSDSRRRSRSASNTAAQENATARIGSIASELSPQAPRLHMMPTALVLFVFLPSLCALTPEPHDEAVMRPVECLFVLK